MCRRRFGDGVRGCLSTLRVRLSPNLPFEAELLRRIPPYPERQSIACDWPAFGVCSRLKGLSPWACVPMGLHAEGSRRPCAAFVHTASESMCRGRTTREANPFPCSPRLPQEDNAQAGRALGDCPSRGFSRPHLEPLQSHNRTFRIQSSADNISKIPVRLPRSMRVKQ